MTDVAKTLQQVGGGAYAYVQDGSWHSTSTRSRPVGDPAEEAGRQGIPPGP